jgi:hypothetical protein
MKDISNETIHQILGSQNTNSGWISFDDLKNYIQEMEAISNEKGLNLTGMRFHFVAEEKDNNQLTVALTPTTNIDGSELDFDPVLSSNETPLILDKVSEESENYTKAGSILDRFLICPTNCLEN